MTQQRRPRWRRDVPLAPRVLAIVMLTMVAACASPQPPPATNVPTAFMSGDADRFYEAGMRARLDGDASTAEQRFRDALTANPRYLAAHLALGEQLLERGAFEQARAQFGEALGLRARSVDALLGRGRAALALGDASASEADAIEARSIADSLGQRMLQAEAEALRGAALQARGASEDAIEAYEAALELEATALSARTQLALLYAARHRPLDAVQLLMRGEGYASTAAEYHAIAAVYVTLDAYPRALPLLETAYALDPSDVGIRYHLALTNTRTANHEGAIRLSSELLRSLPTFLPAYLVRAEARSKIGLVDSARDDVNHVLSIEPDNAEAHAIAGDIDASLGAHESAAAHYDSALLHNPTNRRVVSRAADHAQAHSDANRVIRVLAPVIDVPTREERWLQQYADALVETGRGAEAAPYLSAYALTRLSDHRLQFRAARLALDHPNTVPVDHLLTHARRAIEHVGGAPLAYRVLLIEALVVAGRVDEARAVFALAEDDFPNATELGGVDDLLR